MIDEVKSRCAQMPDRFPDMNWNRDHHPTVASFELHPFKIEVDVVIVKDFMVEIEIIAICDCRFCRHISTSFLKMLPSILVRRGMVRSSPHKPPTLADRYTDKVFFRSVQRKILMGPVRLELTIHGLKGRCLIQLGYGP